MKILGISGSPRKDETSGVAKLVKTVLEASDCEYEYVSLRGKKICGCIACLGCVEDNVCKVQDDFTPLREKIVEADAYVIGAPNYFTGLNALTHALLERWFQFRHRECALQWGKLGVAVGVGGTAGKAPADDIEKFLAYNFIETVAKVTGQGAASCYACGFGETCKMGIPYFLHGEGVKITPEMIPDVGKEPQLLEAAAAAGRLLGERLRRDENRMAIAQRMMRAMQEKFKASA
ncbi:MAG: flavodoxin family protein [Thermodesulfobacteriota bacterium]